MKLEALYMKTKALVGKVKNGMPTSISFHTAKAPAVIIIQPQDEEGEVTIKVTSPNLKSAEYKLRITK